VGEQEYGRRAIIHDAVSERLKRIAAPQPVKYCPTALLWCRRVRDTGLLSMAYIFIPSSCRRLLAHLDAMSALASGVEGGESIANEEAMMG